MKCYLINLLLLFTTYIYCEESSLSKRFSPVYSLGTTVGVSVSQPIHQLAVTANKANAVMYTISSPGRYYISNDINLTAIPGVTPVTAIAINSSDVILDLNGKAIFSDNSGGGTLNCITIAAGVSNVNIINGEIRNFTGSAIRVNGATSRSIQIQNLLVVGCGNSGINVVGATSGLAISSVNTIANTGSGISLSSVTDSVLEDISAIGNTISTSAPTSGISLSSCSNISFKKCIASSNTSSSSATSVSGFNISNSPNCSFYDCSAQGNNSSIAGITVAGFYISSSNSPTFYNCSASGQFATGGAATGVAYVSGFLLTGTIGSLFENCSASNNKYSGATSAGAQNACGFNFLSTSDGSFLKNCTAISNLIANASTTAATTSYAAGFNFNGSNGIILENAISIANSVLATGSTGAGNGVAAGFNINTSSAIEIKSSKASRNSVAASTVTGSYGVGVCITAGSSCSVSDSVFTNNLATGTTGLAAGIAILGTTQNINNIVSKNNLISNTSAAGYWGFVDRSTVTSTLLRSNIAYGQGITMAANNFISSASTNANYFFNQVPGTLVGDVIKETNFGALNAIELGLEYENISLY